MADEHSSSRRETWHTRRSIGMVDSLLLMRLGMRHLLVEVLRRGSSVPWVVASTVLRRGRATVRTLSLIHI